MLAHRASSGSACGPSGRRASSSLSTPPLALVRLQQQLRRRQSRIAAAAARADAASSSSSSPTSSEKTKDSSSPSPRARAPKKKQKTTTKNAVHAGVSSSSSMTNGGSIGSRSSEAASPALSSTASSMSSSSSSSTTAAAATATTTTISPPAPTTTIRAPGSKPRPAKAELYLYRTDGRSCTRETVEAGGTLKLAHPSTQQQLLVWRSRPRSVLVLKRLGEESREEFSDVVDYLGSEQGMLVLVEPHELERTAASLAERRRRRRRRREGGGGGGGRGGGGGTGTTTTSNNDDDDDDIDFLDTFTEREASSLASTVDFVVCLGGDGLVLHASSLFRSAIPPVISFNMGSLGFLTNHGYHEHREALDAVINGRERLESCSVGNGNGNGAAATGSGEQVSINGNGSSDGSINGSSNGNGSGSNGNDAGVHITLRMRLECQVVEGSTGKPRGEPFDVLNEVVVDRGASPYLTKIECWERGRLVTKVQADGVMLATTTGSTAYSVAAGGSMVHPNVPAILFTPICPHSLSFRPVVLPDYAELELRIAGDMRSTAMACFDGKHRRELARGDAVRVRMSANPVPTISKADSTNDWFDTLNRCFGWNERLEQRPYWGPDGRPPAAAGSGGSGSGGSGGGGKTGGW